MSAITKMAAERPDEYAYKSPTVRVTLGVPKGNSERRSRSKRRPLKKPFDQTNNEDETQILDIQVV